MLAPPHHNRLKRLVPLFVLTLWVVLPGCVASRPLRSPHVRTAEPQSLGQAVENTIEVAERALDNAEAWLENRLR